MVGAAGGKQFLANQLHPLGVAAGPSEDSLAHDDGLRERLGDACCECVG